MGLPNGGLAIGPAGAHNDNAFRSCIFRGPTLLPMMTKRLGITRSRWVFGLGLTSLLISAGVGIAASGRETPLADAVEHGDKQAAAALLKSGADVNATQSDGATALHW